MTWEVEGISSINRRLPKKTWWECVKDDMESVPKGCAVWE